MTVLICGREKILLSQADQKGWWSASRYWHGLLINSWCSKPSEFTFHCFSYPGSGSICLVSPGLSSVQPTQKVLLGSSGAPGPYSNTQIGRPLIGLCTSIHSINIVTSALFITIKFAKNWDRNNYSDDKKKKQVYTTSHYLNMWNSMLDFSHFEYCQLKIPYVFYICTCV